MYCAVVNQACKLQLFSSKVLRRYLMMQKMTSEINGLTKAGAEIRCYDISRGGRSVSFQPCVKLLFLSARLF